MTPDQEALEYFGPFIGSELTDAECHDLGFSRLKRKAYKGREAFLYRVKWFDYRTLHPVKATYLFAHMFIEEYRAAYKLRIDVDRGNYVRPYKGTGDIFHEKTNKQISSAMWRARQAADLRGIPYNLYCYAIFRWTEIVNFSNLPRPNHFYSEEMRDKATEYWLDVSHAATVLPKLPTYRVENFKGTKDQRAAHKYLINMLKARQDPRYLMQRLVYEDRLLPELVAAKHFGKEYVKSCSPS